MSSDDNSNMGMNTVVAPGPTSANDGSVVNAADSFEAAIPVVAQQQGTFAISYDVHNIFASKPNILKITQSPLSLILGFL